MRTNRRWMAGGEPPPRKAIAGGGNLKSIVEAAARRWERVFPNGDDDWDLTIEYLWADTLPLGAAYGVEQLAQFSRFERPELGEPRGVPKVRKLKRSVVVLGPPQSPPLSSDVVE